MSLISSYLEEEVDMALKTIDVLHDLDSDVVEDLVAILNRYGIVSDEDGSCLDSTMIEYWNDECDSFLKSHGYHGGELKSTGNYFDFHGAVYAQGKIMNIY
ncbi:hypothetical protein JYB87_09260 [Shewanella avicenniae]|uniref:Antirestriction protein n=1 Tax=Shewanella avicenniae TaxID=2814294 RepID=A0ABX7QWJ6_9GAMM|nr:hypothetical protein [Shewanella avicenniae]QSX35350.1 hypothetical protein JYB87_09260 [Shewanella avicenniae]